MTFAQSPVKEHFTWNKTRVINFFVRFFASKFPQKIKHLTAPGVQSLRGSHPRKHHHKTKSHFGLNSDTSIKLVVAQNLLRWQIRRAPLWTGFFFNSPALYIIEICNQDSNLINVKKRTFSSLTPFKSIRDWEPDGFLFFLWLQFVELHLTHPTPQNNQNRCKRKKK